MRAVNDIGNAAILIAVVLLVVFLVQYSVLAKWYKDPIGRTVVFLDVIVLELLVPSAIGTIWPSWSFLRGNGYVCFEVAILVQVVIGMAWRIAVWQREAVKARTRRRSLR